LIMGWLNRYNVCYREGMGKMPIPSRCKDSYYFFLDVIIGVYNVPSR